jgi:hypothetical protein
VEDEYSHPPTGPGDERRRPRAVDLAELGVEVPLRHMREQTRRVYAAPLTDAAYARIRAKTRRGP